MTRTHRSIDRRRTARRVAVLVAAAATLVAGCGGSASRVAQFADDIGRSTDDVTRSLDDYMRIVGGTEDDALRALERLYEQGPSKRQQLVTAIDDLATRYENATSTPTGDYVVGVLCDLYDEVKESGSFDQFDLYSALTSELQDRQAGFDTDAIVDVAGHASEILSADNTAFTFGNILFDELVLGCPL